jgi:hypothetical protein
VLDGNQLTGAVRERGDWKNIDSQMEGFIALCSVIGKVPKISLASCQLGPASAAELAKAVSNAGAALIKVDVSGNSEIGGEGKTALQTAIHGRQPTIELVV